MILTVGADPSLF